MAEKEESRRFEFKDRTLASKSRITPPEAGKRKIYWDTMLSGFGLRLTDKSAPATGSFVLVARFPGSNNPTARHIGDWPKMSLARAREIAQEWSDNLRQGLDPKLEAERQRREEAKRRASTFKAEFENYADDKLARLRSGDAVKATVARYATPAWGDMPLKEIKRADVLALIRAVKVKKPIAANRLLSFLKTFFTWALDYELIDDSPAASIKRQTSEKERARDRVLSDEEIKALWHACESRGSFGRAFKVMLLTGQRRTEVGAMRWSEIDLATKTWTIPKGRMKAKHRHTVPLSDLAISVIYADRRSGEFVFSSGRRNRNGAYGPLKGWGKSKAKAMEAVERGAGKNAAEEIWRLHDLRRTVSTRINELGFSDVVADKVLDHATTRVSATYNRHKFEQEKRQALDAWARKLDEIVSGVAPAPKVVSLLARAK